LPASAKFCFECATPVSASGSAPRLASPEAYTPKHLAERITNSKAPTEGVVPRTAVPALCRVYAPIA
jgi:hypothetical protein